MKNKALFVGAVGIAVNFLLFLAKLYIGVASNSLSVYCDAINNLGDTFACGVAVLGFALCRKLGDLQSARAQSLCTFVISLLIAVTGGYFVYNGLGRLLYPLPISYSALYAGAISATVAVKLALGIFFHRCNKTVDSPVLRALALDSLLDCLITLFTLMGLFLIVKVNYAVDGIFAILCGGVITAEAIKNIVAQARFLVTNEENRSE